MKKLMMMVVAVATVLVAWADTETVGGYTWTYSINGDTAEIAGTYDSGSYYYIPAISPKPTGAVTIPATLGGKTVTSIGSSAFSGCSGLTSVTIPESVTNIGNYAFSYCSGLTSVTIPDGVTTIGWGAFEDCASLNSIIIGANVSWIGYRCFANCTSLTNVTFAEGDVPLSVQAPFANTPLTELHLPARWYDIGGGEPIW